MADRRDHERHLLCAACGLRLAAAAQGFSADDDGLRLVSALSPVGLVRDHQPPSSDARPRPGRARFPFVERAFVDSAYNTDRVRDATSITMKVVSKIAN